MARDRFVARRGGVEVTAEAIGTGVWVSFAANGEQALRVLYPDDPGRACDLLADLERRLTGDGWVSEPTPTANNDIDEP